MSRRRPLVRRFPRRLARTLLAALACLTAVAGMAQGWTVQTVAVRDLREARHVAADLVSLGYDAYTEFSMDDEGRQWVRVRVGCYHARPGAEAMAGILRGHVTKEAVAVVRTPTAPARGCVRRVVGFRAPDTWTQPVPDVATFIVEVADVRGVIRFDDGRWRVLQEAAAEALAPGSVVGRLFRQDDSTPRPFVRVRHADGDFFVCPGTLLAQDDVAAVVEDEGVVLACTWRPPRLGTQAEAP